MHGPDPFSSFVAPTSSLRVSLSFGERSMDSSGGSLRVNKGAREVRGSTARRSLGSSAQRAPLRKPRQLVLPVCFRRHALTADAERSQIDGPIVIGFSEGTQDAHETVHPQMCETSVRTQQALVLGDRARSAAHRVDDVSSNDRETQREPRNSSLKKSTKNSLSPRPAHVGLPISYA